MDRRLIVICGPTATGKTTLALSLARKFNGELISADSRQVYKGMDVGTGKDIPESFEYCISNIGFQNKNIPFYSDGLTKIWGYDLADPKEEFSVSHYIEIARSVISDVWMRGRLPILVGGTGFYIKGIVDGVETAMVPKNLELRKLLENKSREELFEILSMLDVERAGLLNESDRKNPRRLTRAIEIAKFGKLRGEADEVFKTERTVTKKNILMVGLYAPKAVLEKGIERRVGERIKKGVYEEIKNLLKEGVSWDMQSMNTLGYKEWKGYFQKKNSNGEVVKRWILDETRYAKRQMTWFKKDERVRWFDISDNSYTEEVEKTIEKWQNKE